MSAIAQGRRLIRRVSHRVETGTEPVAIDELVSPLRYDILVRQRFLDRIATAAGDDDVRAAVAAPEGRAYFAWFSGIVVPRFLPDLAGDARAIRTAFEYRVRSSVALCESFASSGYDSAQPVVLRPAGGSRRRRPASGSNGDSSPATAAIDWRCCAGWASCRSSLARIGSRSHRS